MRVPGCDDTLKASPFFLTDARERAGSVSTQGHEPRTAVDVPEMLSTEATLHKTLRLLAAGSGLLAERNAGISDEMTIHSHV